MAAIEEVKKGMSALQAARKYGVPSRTLYDKVKKMGITTGRQVQRKSLPQYQAAFPRGLGVSKSHTQHTNCVHNNIKYLFSQPQSKVNVLYTIIR